MRGGRHRKATGSRLPDTCPRQVRPYRLQSPEIQVSLFLRIGNLERPTTIRHGNRSLRLFFVRASQRRPEVHHQLHVARVHVRESDRAERLAAAAVRPRRSSCVPRQPAVRLVQLRVPRRGHVCGDAGRRDVRVPGSGRAEPIPVRQQARRLDRGHGVEERGPRASGRGRQERGQRDTAGRRDRDRDLHVAARTDKQFDRGANQVLRPGRVRLPGGTVRPCREISVRRYTGDRGARAHVGLLHGRDVRDQGKPNRRVRVMPTVDFIRGAIDVLRNVNLFSSSHRTVSM